MTAPSESERSWLPPAPSRSIRRVWYGEPGMETAEFVRPQSAREAMWPPQASTGLATLAVKVTAIRADLSPTKPAPSAYEYGLTLVMSPPNMVRLPAIGVTPPPVTCGSAGIGNVSVGARGSQPTIVTPRQGLASVTLWLYESM